MLKIFLLVLGIISTGEVTNASQRESSPSLSEVCEQGILRSSLALGLEYPCMVLSTYSSAYNLSPHQAFTQIYKTEGWRGLWKGGLLNTPRYVMWIPRMYFITSLPFFLEETWGVKQRSLSSGILTGAVTSLADGLVLGPVDRLRVAALTYKTTPIPRPALSFGYMGFLYTGFISRLAHSSVGWIAFITSENALKKAWPLDPEAPDQYHYLRETLMGAVVGAAMMTASTPLVVLANNLQAEKTLSSRSILGGLREIYRKQGLSPFLHTSKILAFTYIPSAIMTLLAKHKTD